MKDDDFDGGRAWCERGNTLLANDGGGMVAWLDAGGGKRLEVSWQPENYPALNVRMVSLTDAELLAHIAANLSGWHIRKLNLAGADALGWRDRVPEPQDTEGDE